MSNPFIIYVEFLPVTPSPGPLAPVVDRGGRNPLPRMDDPPWEWGSSEPPDPPPMPQLVYQLLLQVELELSLYVAAAALLYAFMLVFLNSECPRIVEKNPRKFKIDGGELASRRTFIEHTKEEVKSMKERLNLTKKDRDVTARQPVDDNSPLKMPQVVTHGATRYSRLVNEADSPNSEFVERTLAQQQMIMNQQDGHLDQIASSMGTLKNMSRQIGQEVDEQAVMLDDFGHEMETTQSKMENTLSKMAKVMHLSNDRRQWAAIGALSGVLAVVLILFFVL
nr:syntaxin-6-like isoform X2 [Procambarus clarkii]